MALFITGAAGFLGRHLLMALGAAEGAAASLQDPFGTPQVVALVQDRKAWAQMSWTRALSQVTVVEGSVLEPERWQDHAALTSLTGVFHLAALVRHSRYDADEVYRVNVEGTRKMMQLAAQHRCRLVFVSTSGTVGCFSHQADHADEEAPHCAQAVKRWPYYDAKIKAERLALELAQQNHVELVIIRPPILLGPHDHRFRSTGYVKRFLERRLPFKIRGGIHFVDVRDVAQALVAAMNHPHPRPVYHMPGTACCIETFFKDLEDLSGVPAPRWCIPYPAAWSLTTAGAWLSRRLGRRCRSCLPDPVVVEMARRYWNISSRYAQQDLGFEARDGHQTLADTITWLQHVRTDAGKL